MLMRNFFLKNYISYALLILISFSLAGVIFCFQINKYSLNEKQEQLEITANDAADMTGTLLSNYSALNDVAYQLYIRQQAKSKNSSIVVTQLSGNIILYANPSGFAAGPLGKINEKIVMQTLNKNYYSDMGTMAGLFADMNYIIGTPCKDAAGTPVALVFVGTSAGAVAGLLQEVMQTFLMVLSVALFGTLVMSYFIAGKMTRPLKTMALASKRFARGDFSIRVPEDNRCDEIDELAISFNNMANSLEQLEDLSRNFVANVSHELKTPMTSIGGFVDGMLDGTIPEEKRDQYLSIISDEVKRLSRLIMRMLDAAKIQAGELVLNPAPFDISEMASRIVLSFEKPINDKKIEVDIDFEDRLIVCGDRDHVFQVVYNLVDNAVKFTEEGGCLTLRAKKEGNRSLFTIKNTGSSIPEEDLPHVFDRFYKVDRSRSRDKTGAGLGLYIVKTIVNLHGGDISVRSNGGETEFSFTLPLASKQQNQPKIIDTK